MAITFIEAVSSVCCCLTSSAASLTDAFESDFDSAILALASDFEALVAAAYASALALAISPLFVPFSALANASALAFAFALSF